MSLLVITRVLFPIAFMALCLGSLSMSCSLLQLVLLGVPWSVFYSMYALYSTTNYLFQMLYFMFLSYDCKLEFREINCRLKSLTKIKNRLKFRLILRKTMDQTYKNHRDFMRIDEFWSVYLFFNWIAMSVILGGYLVLILFCDLGVAANILFITIFIVSLQYLSILIYSATIVFNETNKTYKILNSLLLESNRNIKLSTKFKVNLLILKLVKTQILFDQANDVLGEMWSEISRISLLDTFPYKWHSCL